MKILIGIFLVIIACGVTGIRDELAEIRKELRKIRGGAERGCRK